MCLKEREKKTVCMSSLKEKKSLSLQRPLLKWTHCLNPGFQEFQVINLSNLNSCQPWGREWNSAMKEGGIWFQLCSGVIQENDESQASTDFICHSSHTISTQYAPDLNSLSQSHDSHMPQNVKHKKIYVVCTEKKWLEIDNNVTPMNYSCEQTG